MRGSPELFPITLLLFLDARTLLALGGCSDVSFPIPFTLLPLKP
jgi:hypothetical protein